jgi:hypothetical protein
LLPVLWQLAGGQSPDELAVNAALRLQRTPQTSHQMHLSA